MRARNPGRTIWPIRGPTPKRHSPTATTTIAGAAGSHAALTRLSARERRIVEARQLSEMSLTLEDLGREFGVSKERVRQLEQRALGRLKKEVLAQASA